MKIEIKYELELSDEDLEILERYWKASIGEDCVQYLMSTSGYQWITRHIDECREKLQREAVSPAGSNKQC